MKKIRIPVKTGIITIVLLAQASLPAFAQDFGGNGLLKDVKQWMNQASRTAERQQDELQRIIHQADSMITMRLNSLTELNTRIQNDSRLSSSEKNSLLLDIQSDITGLTALKTKIDADTTVAAARSDIKQIVTSYYVYARFVPKMRLLITLNNLQTVTVNLQAIVPQIQNLINTFQSQGKDVSQIQSQLNDLSSQLQTIATTISHDINTVQNVSVTTDPQSTFTQVKQDITQIVHTGYMKVRSDFSQIRALFRQLIFGTPNITTSSGSSSATGTQIAPTSSPIPSQ